MDESISSVTSSDIEAYDHGCKVRGMLRLALSLIGLGLLMTGIALSIIAGIKKDQNKGKCPHAFVARIFLAFFLIQEKGNFRNAL